MNKFIDYFYPYCMMSEATGKRSITRSASRKSTEKTPSMCDHPLRNGDFIKFQDQTVAYYRFDPKKRVLQHDFFFIHGAFTNVGLYEPFLEKLANVLQVRIHAVDLLGHGYSSGIVNDIDTDLQVKMLVSILENIDGLSKKIYLLSHSMGSYLSMKLLPHLGKKIRGLLFVSPALALSAYMKSTVPSVPGILLPLVKGVLGLVPKAFSIWNGITTSKTFSDSNAERKRKSIDLVEQDQFNFPNGPLTSVFSYFLALQTYGGEIKRIGTLGIPLVAIFAQDDHIVDNDTVIDYVDTLGGRYVIIKDVGHAVPYEDPAILVRTIENIMRPPKPGILKKPQ